MHKALNINKTENIVNEFIKQIYELDGSKKTLEDKLLAIDNLLNNLIDYCIKKKIFYYVENKISYSNIVNNFKTHLVKFIKKLVDPSNNIINKYITSTSNTDKNPNSNVNWDNVSDINSLMFRNFKQLNESFEKNVSFGEQIQITNYDEGNDGFEYNIKSSNDKISNNNSFNSSNNSNINSKLIGLVDNIEEENDLDEEIKNLSLYIKILINQNKYLVEFVDKLIQMCKILSNTEIKYKKTNPSD